MNPDNYKIYLRVSGASLASSNGKFPIICCNFDLEETGFEPRAARGNVANVCIFSQPRVLVVCDKEVVLSQ